LIERPFYCDYGENIRIGHNFYANYGCIFLDVNRITIGDNVFLGPRVCLYTAGHPIDHLIRNEQYEFGYPITIGDDVWIGGDTRGWGDKRGSRKSVPCHPGDYKRGPSQVETGKKSDPLRNAKRLSLTGKFAKI